MIFQLVIFKWNVRVLKYTLMKILPPIPPKKHSLKSQTSYGLGVLSIIIALIALIMTIGMKDGIKEVSGGGGWVFVFFLFVIPLMILSFTMSMIGMRLRNRTLEGKRLCEIRLILTFSPILMVIIMLP